MPDPIEYILNRQFEFAFVSCAILLEMAVRSRLAKTVVNKQVFIDLIYCGFYRFGIYSFLMGSPIDDFFHQHIRMGIIADTPVWIRAALFIPIQDLGYYATHRATHSVPFLWAFHQVHHSQEDMGILATYRLHPVDMWIKNFVGPTIFLVLLGLPLRAWLPLTLLYDVLINLSHLEVKWTYGRLGKVFVSPVFHSIHHSVDERHRNANYSAVLSIWDRLFGTVYESPVRADVVGLPGWRVKDNFFAQMWAPFPALKQYFRGEPIRELAPFEEVHHAPIEDDVET